MFVSIIVSIYLRLYMYYMLACCVNLGAENTSLHLLFNSYNDAIIKHRQLKPLL